MSHAYKQVELEDLRYIKGHTYKINLQLHDSRNDKIIKAQLACDKYQQSREFYGENFWGKKYCQASVHSCFRAA